MKSNKTMRAASTCLGLLAFGLAGAAPAVAESVDFEVLANLPVTLYDQSTPLLPLGGGAYLTEEASVFGGDPYFYGTVVELVPPRKKGQAYSVRTVFAFSADTVGNTPNSGVVDPSGTLIGTTLLGGLAMPPYGTYGGTIFSLAPPAHGMGPWKGKLLHVFAGCRVSPCDGATPTHALTPDGKGVYYGFTKLGGDSNAGTIYSLAHDQQGAWHESVLYSFPPQEQASQDYYGLLIDSAGNLYGSSISGGKYDHGFIFKLAPPATPGGTWTYSTLYQFTGGADGAYPNTKLIMDQSGALYGTGDGGGSFGSGFNAGVVYKLVQDAAGRWQESVLASFGGTSGPVGYLLDLAQSKEGDLYSGSEFGYGTAIDGSDEANGTIFRLAKPATGSDWPLTVLHGFPYCPSRCPGGQLPKNIAIEKDTPQALELGGQNGYGGTRGDGTVFTIKLKP